MFYDSISQMEPMQPDGPHLRDKAVELLKLSQRLSGRLHPITQRRIAKMLRVMNSYYSNLIEGNFTHPIDLERAVRGDYSAEPKKKAMQIEGAAHIEVQEAAENELRENPALPIASAAFLCRLHKQFYSNLPPEFRIIRTRDGGELTVVPGRLRQDDVEVGEHLPPSWRVLPQFMSRIEGAYDPQTKSTIDRIISAAAAHHRLAWVHPFLDGNGRVIRLFTHLYFTSAEVDSNGLWSLARGLARRREDYYAMLANADRQRDNDYDGRGNLSMKGLNNFVDFILDVAIDQVQFMSKMLEIDSIIDRIADYVTLLSIRGEVHEAAKYLMIDIALRGEVPRSEVPRITGIPDERMARRVTQSLAKKGLISSSTSRAPLRLDLPLDAVAIMFPSLYPAGASLR